MKKLLLVTIVSVFGFLSVDAQTFITKGIIEYEMKSNIRKNMNGEDFWDQMIMDKVPEFKVGYFNLTFDENKSFFKWTRWQNANLLPSFLRNSDEETFYYKDLTNEKFFTSKYMYGAEINIMDTLPKLKWQIGNETRDIAGFRCKKATTVLFDSVYIFAFYTDEIIPSVGPISVHGLPGAIMGITIPRLYTSYVATKVTVQGVKDVTPPKQPNKSFTRSSYKEFLTEQTSDWFRWNDDDKNREIYKQRFFWTMQL